jgi:hypothetical protein
MFSVGCENDTEAGMISVDETPEEILRDQIPHFV